MKSIVLLSVAGISLGVSARSTVGNTGAEAVSAAVATTGHGSSRNPAASPPPVPQTAQTTPPRASADMQAELDALTSLNPHPLPA